MSGGVVTKERSPRRRAPLRAARGGRPAVLHDQSPRARLLVAAPASSRGAWVSAGQAATADRPSAQAPRSGAKTLGGQNGRAASWIAMTSAFRSASAPPTKTRCGGTPGRRAPTRASSAEELLDRLTVLSAPRRWMVEASRALAGGERQARRADREIGKDLSTLAASRCRPRIGEDAMH